MSIRSLSYDTPRYPTPTVWLHYVALACGLIPLGVGTAIFLLFQIIRLRDLAVLGFLTILAGTCMAFVGITCASVYLYQTRRSAPDEGTRARQRARNDLVIIIANFPIAFGMAWLGIWLMSHVTITVHNRDALPAEQFRLVTYDGTRDFGTIAPDATNSITLSDDDFDDLSFTFVCGGVPRKQTLSDERYDEVPADGHNVIALSIKDGEVKEE